MIKDLRMERHLTKARLARESLISDAYLLQIERGDRSPSEKVLRRIAYALKVNPAQLLIPAGAYRPEEVEYWTKRVDARDTPLQPLWDTPEEEAGRLEAIGYYLERSAAQDAEHQAEVYDKHGDLVEAATPEGWLEITRKDRRLIQQLINRLRYVESEE